MLVSVIVPVYNVEKYVGECIESILNQTYKDIEILLIDDGSGDNSKKICEEYVQKDDRVHYFLKEHSGLSATRDYGISKCRGDFFIFVDSDDTIKPELIEKVLPFFIEDVDVVAYGMESPDDGYVLRNVQDDDFFLEKYSDRIDFIMNVLLESKIFFSVCNKMYRKNLFVEHDIHPVSDVIIGEDLAINLQVFTFARRVRAINDKLYEYWLRDDSLMNRDKEHTYYFNDFCNIMYFFKNRLVPQYISMHDYRYIYVKTMDNQFMCRYGRNRIEFENDLKKVVRKDFFVKECMRVFFYPVIFWKLFKEETNIHSKWLDYLFSARVLKRLKDK